MRCTQLSLSVHLNGSIMIVCNTSRRTPYYGMDVTQRNVEGEKTEIQGGRLLPLAIAYYINAWYLHQCLICGVMCYFV